MMLAVCGWVLGVAVIAVVLWACFGGVFSRRFSYSETAGAGRRGADQDQ